MSKSQRLYATLAAVVLIAGTLAAALIWGTGSGPALAAADADPIVARKSASSQEVAPGQTVGYTIVVTNSSGSVLDALKVADSLDTDLSYVAFSAVVEPLGSGLLSGDQDGTITFTLLTMEPDKVVTITFEAGLAVDAVPGSTIANTAQIYSGTTQIYGTDVVTFNVSPTPDLQIYSPASGAVITQRPGGKLVVSGRAWVQSDPAPFPTAPVLYPVIPGGSTDFLVDWSDSVGAYRYVWYESTDPQFGTVSDSGSVLVADGSSTFRTGRSPGTYYYRVRAYTSDPTRFSRYSNVEGITLTASGALSAAPAADDVAPVTESASVLASALISVEVSVDGGTEWYTAALTDTGEWWDWSYDWTLPEADGVQYPIMARAAYVSGGEYSQDTITVTLDNSGCFIYMPIIYKRWPPVPYPPTLNDITPTGSDYTVSWTYTSSSSSVPVPTEYQLQQASDSAFTQNVVNYTVGGTSRSFTGMAGGSYYYRVRGKNSYGYGEWSNTKSVLLGRTYEFASSVEGWVVKRSDEDDNYHDTPQSVWKDGNLYHLIWGSADFSILSPMQTGPTVPYTIKARADIVNSETINGQYYQAKSGMTYGIIFGGNNGTPCPALRTSSGCLSHYYRILVAWDQARSSFKWELKRIDSHDEKGAGRGVTLVDWTEVSGVSYDALGWNEWKIEVTNAATNNITVSMNNHVLAQRTDHTYINDRYFGTFAASLNELGAVATKWDWFRVQ